MPKPLKYGCIVKADAHEGDVVGETLKIYSQGLGDCKIEQNRRLVGTILRRSWLFLHFSWFISFEDGHVYTPFCEAFCEDEGGQQADNWPGSKFDN
jgi:hypothetical protein